jgi:L-lysine exporter family protein LysE/ArgO
MFLALLKGFTTGGSLIVAIGAQNAFVMQQGLLRRHLLLTAFLCSLLDALLICFGVLGFGQVITEYPFAVELSKYFAIIFLLFYGIFSFKSVFKAKSLDHDEKAFPSRKRTVAVLLALCLLNPHVYLDTVILLGSIASQQPAHEQLYFAFGAMVASFVWFFSITYGSRVLAPFLQNPMAWRVIDGLIAITMWGIALSLLLNL